MWAIDTTDVFVFCFHSLSVSSANCHLSLSRGRGYESGACGALVKSGTSRAPSPTDGGEGKRKRTPEDVL